MGQQQIIDETTSRFGPVDISNGLRLSCRQWLIVAMVALPLIVLSPRLWKQVEAFSLTPDYRLPHELGNDFWLYERMAEQAARQYDVLLIGDSVVWGEYATRHETLSHYLNELAGRERYANCGLDGVHPLALASLVEHYAGSVAGKQVLLHLNPMWLREAKTDLQDDQAPINHPRLVPQFVPRLPGYKEEISPRLGILVEQRLSFSKWTNHLQQAYYDQTDIPEWTLKNPYKNPLGPLAKGLPAPDSGRRQEVQPWYKRGITKQDFPWVDPATSRQWPAFLRAVAILQQRGNRVFVLVGPFNEHLLTPASLARYRHVKAIIAGWLQKQGIPHAIPEPLPSEHYGDASHPLPEGYALLARQLWQDRQFRSGK